MAKQINLTHLQNTALRAKQYVDDQSTANVIRTETILWSGKYSVADNTQSATVQTENTFSIWGGSNYIALSDRADEYDALEVYVDLIDAQGTQSKSSGQVFTVTIDSLKSSNAYPIYWLTALIKPDNTTVSFGVGLVAANRLGVAWSLNSDPAQLLAYIAKVKGIKYTNTDLVNYPNLWTPGQEIDLGNGLYGYHYVKSNISLPANNGSFQEAVVATTSAGRIVEIGGTQKMITSSGIEWYDPIGVIDVSIGGEGSVQKSATAIFYWFDGTIYALTTNNTSNQITVGIDGWIKYTKASS